MRGLKRALYFRFGFVYCAPFGDYVLDPNSVFMTLELLKSPPRCGRAAANASPAQQ